MKNIAFNLDKINMQKMNYFSFFNVALLKSLKNLQFLPTKSHISHSKTGMQRVFNSAFPSAFESYRASGVWQCIWVRKDTTAHLHAGSRRRRADNRRHIKGMRAWQDSRRSDLICVSPTAISNCKAARAPNNLKSRPINRAIPPYARLQPCIRGMSCMWIIKGILRKISDCRKTRL